MKASAQLLSIAAARLAAPLIVLLGLLTLAQREPGGGVGFVAGTAVAVGLVLHALVFGVGASRRAMPPVMARLLLGGGVIGAVVGAGLPGLTFAEALIEGAAFVATLGAAALIVQSVFGRVPTLRDEGA
jgi:multisubunit Na+/H+ antiporter MnhB subunit